MRDDTHTAQRLPAWFPEHGDLVRPIDPIWNLSGVRNVSVGPGWRLRLDPSVTVHALSSGTLRVGRDAPMRALHLSADLGGGVLRAEVLISPAEWLARRPVAVSFALGPVEARAGGAALAGGVLSVMVCLRAPGQPLRTVATLAASVPVPERGAHLEYRIEPDDREALAEAMAELSEDSPASPWLCFVSRSPQLAFSLGAVALQAGRHVAPEPPAPPAVLVRPAPDRPAPDRPDPTPPPAAPTPATAPLAVLAQPAPPHPAPPPAEPVAASPPPAAPPAALPPAAPPPAAPPKAAQAPAVPPPRVLPQPAPAPARPAPPPARPVAVPSPPRPTPVAPPPAAQPASPAAKAPAQAKPSGRPAAENGDAAVLARINAGLTDLEKKLWGGHSGFAARELARIAQSPFSHPEARGRAAWELARWQASHGNHATVLAMLAEARDHSPGFAKLKKVRVLEVDALLRSGRLAAAGAELEKIRRSHPQDADFAALAANWHLFRARAGEIGEAEAAERRLGEINPVLERAGLAPIRKAPEAAALTVGALRCTAAPVGDGNAPLITVLMAAYNAEEHLALALGSVLAQTWRNLEVVVVNDCSTDGTWRLLQDFAARDPRLRIFSNDGNMGAYPTRNRALGLATGDYITVHDSDDWSHPQMLEVQIRALLERPELRATFSMMARVTEDMQFATRPARRKVEIVHRSHPSFLIARRDLDQLGEWDGVRANADAEMVARVRQRFGADSLENVLPDVPLSFFLIRPESLTEQKDIGLLSLGFGARHEYERQAEHMRAKAAAAGRGFGPRTGRKDPFACPDSLLPAALRREPRYDLVIVSDLARGGGTRSAILADLDAAVAAGMRVGLFHWPRADLPGQPDIQHAYRERNQLDCVDMLTWEQEVRAARVVLHHPAILRHALDKFLRIQADEAAILADAPPADAAPAEGEGYDPHAAEALFEQLFGRPPVWIPASAALRRQMLGRRGFTRVAAQDWTPALPFLDAVNPREARQDRAPVIGRHATDRPAQWPKDPAELEAAYCAATGIRVRFLGGAETALRLRGSFPKNWEVLPPDSLPVEAFLDSLDFLVHFPDPDHAPDDGRLAIEAMARAVPVILPPAYAPLFGDAAAYCAPGEVAETVRRLWRSRPEYRALSARGRDFAAAQCGPDRLAERLTSPLRW